MPGGRVPLRGPSPLAFLWGLTAVVMVFAVLVILWMYWLAELVVI